MQYAFFAMVVAVLAMTASNISANKYLKASWKREDELLAMVRQSNENFERLHAAHVSYKTESDKLVTALQQECEALRKMVTLKLG